MDLDLLYVLMKKEFGYKGRMHCHNAKRNEVGTILYDSFLFVCSIDEKKQRVLGGIVVGDQGERVKKVFGHDCVADFTEDGVRSMFRQIDTYCRLRLPDNYLDQYHQAYVGKLNSQTDGKKTGKAQSIK